MIGVDRASDTIEKRWHESPARPFGMELHHTSVKGLRGEEAI